MVSSNRHTRIFEIEKGGRHSTEIASAIQQVVRSKMEQITSVGDLIVLPCFPELNFSRFLPIFLQYNTTTEGYSVAGSALRTSQIHI